MNTDYSNVTVGKTLDTRETEIVDIDKLIDELSDIDDLSGLSSSCTSDSQASETSNAVQESSATTTTTKRRKKGKAHRRSTQDEEDDDEEEEYEAEKKLVDPMALRNKMVQHLEEMHSASQKLKRSEQTFERRSERPEFSSVERADKSKRAVPRKRSQSSVHIQLTHSFVPSLFIADR